MTSTEPMTYKPGPELDRRIANLIGYVSMTTAMNPDGTYGYTPAFSTSWEGMRLVVERLADFGAFAEIRIHKAHGRSMTGTASCRLYNDLGGIIGAIHNAESAPFAVCLAALAAIEGQET